MSTTVASSDLAEHVLQLARGLDTLVFVRFDTPDGHPNGEYDHDHGEILLTHAPDEPFAYLTALHELGHAAMNPKRDGRMLDREAEAWIWAINESLIPLTPELWAVVAESLGTYEACKRCRRTDLYCDLLAEARRLSSSDLAVQNN